MSPFGAIESCLEKIKACCEGCKRELSAHDDSGPTAPSAALDEATGCTVKQFPAPKKAKPDGPYFLSPTSVWSPKGRTGCGTSARLQRTTAGLRLVRAVKAGKRDRGSCLVAGGETARSSNCVGDYCWLWECHLHCCKHQWAKRQTLAQTLRFVGLVWVCIRWFPTDCVIPARNCKLLDREIGIKIFYI